MGLYGSSRYLISSSDNTTLTAPRIQIGKELGQNPLWYQVDIPIRSSKFLRLVVPTIGAVTPTYGIQGSVRGIF